MIKRLLFGLAALVISLAARGAESGHGDMAKMWQSLLTRPQLSVTTAFDAQGRLWEALVQEGYVYVRHSDDGGKTFGPMVAVNPSPEAISADGENRPKLAFSPQGTLYVSYTRSLDKPFSGYVRFSRSEDGGRSFSAPVTVNDNLDVVSHRFDALAVAADGTIHLAWLDKRDGTALYYAFSRDGGRTFSANRRLADHTCECCRVALAMDTDGTPVVFWRRVYGKNIRDHALLRVDGTSTPVRVSHDEWAVDACPHHGGGLSIAPDGVYHMAWFDDGPQRHGLFYANSRDRGRSFSPPMAFGDYDRQAAHPHVLSLGKRVLLTWKEFDGKEASVWVLASSDGGQSWSAPRRLAATAGASDHPLLVAGKDRAFVSWNTATEGLRLLEVAP